MKEPRLQIFFYRLLFVLFFTSVSLFIYNLFSSNDDLWNTYTKIFTIGVIAYLWQIFLMLFWQELKQKFIKQYPAYEGEHITVLMPCFNEHPVLLVRAVRSAYYAKGNKDIVIIDDGSTNEIQDVLQKLERKEGIVVHRLSTNQGKRHALHFAIKKITDKTQFVVTIDSDTILDENALIKIVGPLKLRNVGAASGDVRLLNEKQNLLTRMIAAYYWRGLNIHRKAQSSIGIVSCCSGCLSAYKREIIADIIDDFVSQTFMGERCTHSEDRHLTNLVLKQGYKVEFVSDAISYTYSPHTLRGFLRQQLRWQRGYIRESTYALSFAWRKKPILFLQLLLWDLTVPFLSFAFVLTGLIGIFVHPIFFLTIVLPSWVIYCVIRNLPLMIHARGKIPGILLFIVFYEFILYWQIIYSLFTVKNRSWITR